MKEKLAQIEDLITDGRKVEALPLLKALVFEHPQNEALQLKLTDLADELMPTPPALPGIQARPKSVTQPPKATPPPPLPDPVLILPKFELDLEEDLNTLKPIPPTPPLPGTIRPAIPAPPSNRNIPTAPPLPETAFDFEVRPTRKPAKAKPK
jgi:hypothetical protein